MLKRIEFSKFIGLDFSNTRYDATSIRTDNMIGFQIFQGRIKNNVIHNPYNFTQLTSNKGKFGYINNKLYILQPNGIYKYENGTYSQVYSHTFNSDTEYYQITKGYKIGTLLNTLTAGEQDDEQYITVQENLETNQYIGKIAVVNGKKYYITSNLNNKLYIELMVEGTITNGDTVQIYEPEEVVILYDGQSVYSFDGTNLTNILDTEKSFIFNYHNKLVVVKPNQIITSTLMESTFFPSLNYINLSHIFDAVLHENDLRIFTDNGTYCLSGLGASTLNLVRYSDFKTSERIFPLVYKGQIFVNIDGKIHIFDKYPKQILNYRLSPNKVKGLWKIEEGLITKMPHDTTNKILLIEYETLENDNILTSVELSQTGNIIDIINYDNKILLSTDNGIFISSGLGPIRVKTNKIILPQKVFIDSIALNQNLTLNITINGQTKTITYNTSNKQNIYNIKQRGSEIEIELISDNPINSFILYYM